MSQGIISRNGRQVLFQRNELSACEAGTAMRHGSVGNRVFAKIGANHLRLYLYRVENLAIVYANNRANHLGDDNHVAQMRAYCLWLLTATSLFLRLAELFDQLHWLPCEAALETAADACAEEFYKSICLHIQKLIEINPTVAELSERALLRRRGNKSIFFTLIEDFIRWVGQLSKWRKKGKYRRRVQSSGSIVCSGSVRTQLFAGRRKFDRYVTTEGAGSGIGKP